ncbi:hypothetical protein [Vibrio gigantis]|uniref:hypothetical protein n=1 Tax=Vibrio gigantis TaxID=296199 RepID=UPI003B847D8B
MQDWVSVIGLLFVIITYFINRNYNKKNLELMKANQNNGGYISEIRYLRGLLLSSHSRDCV